MPEATKQRLLQRTVEIAGMDKVVAALKSPQSAVEAWMNGQASMPNRKLLLLADLLAQYASHPDK